jgi:hypothetical protein
MGWLLDKLHILERLYLGFYFIRFYIFQGGRFLGNFLITLYEIVKVVTYTSAILCDLKFGMKFRHSFMNDGLALDYAFRNDLLFLSIWCELVHVVFYLAGKPVYLISTKGARRVWPVSRGCLLLLGTRSYLRICRWSVLPYTRFCNCLLDYGYVLHIVNLAILYV